MNAATRVLVPALLAACLAGGCKDAQKKPAPSPSAARAVQKEGKLPTPSGPSAGAISSGVNHSCALSSAGIPYCWGYDELGKTAPPRQRLTQLSVSALHGCGLRPDGRVVCWGAGAPGRTGAYHRGQASPPPTTFARVVSGPAASCGITRAGALRCWGEPVVVRLLSEKLQGRRVKDLSFGSTTVCAVLVGGELTCPVGGQLLGGRPPGGRFTAVGVGFAHACALDRDGSVTCWGSDEHGQLKAPTGRFSQLTAGGWHSCALRQDGTVACWGAGARSGDCGPGQDKKPKGDPGLDCGQAAPPPGVFREIAAGWHHTCGVRANGKVVCWGSDHLGQSSPPGR